MKLPRVASTIALTTIVIGFFNSATIKSRNLVRPALPPSIKPVNTASVNPSEILLYSANCFSTKSFAISVFMFLALSANL